jgi:hypothetical protein
LTLLNSKQQEVEKKRKKEKAPSKLKSELRPLSSFSECTRAPLYFFSLTFFSLSFH